VSGGRLFRHNRYHRKIRNSRYPAIPAAGTIPAVGEKDAAKGREIRRVRGDVVQRRPRDRWRSAGRSVLIWLRWLETTYEFV
jgi:hypothetical protein